MISPRTRRTTIAALTTLAVAAAAAPAQASQAPSLPSSCFWVGPYVKQNPGFNVAFPDTGAGYWSTDMKMPEGSTIVLRGRYTHARYQSLIAYNIATTTATDGVNDVQTAPDAGSRNPFRPGAIRFGERHRSYTLTLRNELPPADPALRQPNTLYVGVGGQARQGIVYRVYVPDAGRDLTGGVGLPDAELHLADGTVLSGADACAALQVTNRLLPVPFLTPEQYGALRDKPGAPAGFPALNPTVFRAFYNGQLRTKCDYSLTPSVDCYPATPPQRSVALYPNVDNQYVYALTSREFGKVLVLRGKLPTTPRTYKGNLFMGQGQLRYWSICQNEGLLTTAVEACLYDEQIPVDRNGNYTIVTSLPADRPRNATERCGVAFLPWPANGDGAGHLNDGRLLVRNMLPAPDFHQAVQRTQMPGDEAAVLGPYLPKTEYTSTKQFERLGCR